ncbi:MAG TPA: hypothetical protein VEX15_07015 [Nocardioidaceae bacterium]|nr:hypothetical protein [Nocardioidaceae bacterium]
MSLSTHTRRIGVSFTMGAAAVTVLALTASSASASMQWCGAGRGLTAQNAIQGAIDDATVSASGAGQFSCELVGEPQVFETFNDPIFGHLFRAQVTMSCS